MLKLPVEVDYLGGAEEFLKCVKGNETPILYRFLWTNRVYIHYTLLLPS